MRTTLKQCMALAVASGLASCAGLIDNSNEGAPTLLAMSKTSITIGQPLDFIGGDFLNYSKDGHTEPKFKGTFKAVPERADFLPDIREDLVVELYSK